jgi:formylglycine-generating enzyme required for sulfatase activity
VKFVFQFCLIAAITILVSGCETVVEKEGSRAGEVFQDCPECPEMVVLPAGSFHMGDNNEKSVHLVEIPQSFAVGKYEVSQAEWRFIMGNNPSRWKNDRNPVEQITWDEVQEFVKKLSSKAGKPYRLLSESEWEYAARAGGSTEYSFGNDIGSGNANCDGCGSPQDNRTAPVDSFQPNDFGLYNMHGNVAEWVADCWSQNYNSAPNNQTLGKTGICKDHIIRGGSWYSTPKNLRSSSRKRTMGNRGLPIRRFTTIGFRVARAL